MLITSRYPLPVLTAEEFNGGAQMASETWNKVLTRDDAAGELYRLAQAQTMIDSTDAGIDFPNDPVTGKVIPTRKAIHQMKRENPELVRLANQR